MLVFPFLGRPVIQVILDMDEEGFSKFIDAREAFIPDYLVGMVMKKSCIEIQAMPSTYILDSRSFFCDTGHRFF